LATSMNRLTNIVRRISYQRCNVLSHFHKIHRRFRLQRVFPLHPLRCHPGLVCAFALDLAIVGTLPPPEAKSPALGRRSGSGNRTQGPFFTTTCLCYLIVADCRKRRFTIQPYTSAEVPPANIDPASRCRKNPSSYPDLGTSRFVQPR
jgi:hypothetical protein